MRSPGFTSRVVREEGQRSPALSPHISQAGSLPRVSFTKRIQPRLTSRYACSSCYAGLFIQSRFANPDPHYLKIRILIAIDSVSSSGCIGIGTVPYLLYCKAASLVRYQIFRLFLFSSFLSVKGLHVNIELRRPGTGTTLAHRVVDLMRIRIQVSSVNLGNFLKKFFPSYLY